MKLYTKYIIYKQQYPIWSVQTMGIPKIYTMTVSIKQLLYLSVRKFIINHDGWGGT
jgi:hypothetical protein